MQTLSMWEYSLILKEGEEILNQRLKKIYQIGEKKFLFSFGKKGLVINLGQNFYFSSTKNTALKQASNFVMLLRKHLQGKKLISFYQYDFDRYYILEFFPNYKLVLKQFSKGNMILLQEEKVIAFFYAEEELKKGDFFSYPPKKEFEQRIYFGKKYENSQEIDKGKIKDIKEFLVYNNEVWAIEPKDIGLNITKKFSSLSEAIEFLDRIEEEKKPKEMDVEKEKIKQKLQKRLQNQKQNLEDIEKQIIFFKKAIEHIKQNMEKIEQELQTAKKEGKKFIKIAF
ncbi:MAG: NFACT family protein [Candidatus Anstonellaceae archaeon]